MIFKRFFSSPATIYALSTHPGKSAIAVVRVSGPAAADVYRSITKSSRDPKPRQAVVKRLWDGDNLLDEALCLYFKAPHSYTGEDLVEFQLHGGGAVVNAVTKKISGLNSKEVPVRYAERGEFSQRGFQNGRFDLTQAEGINDLINAETEWQRRSVLQSVKGETKELFTRWRQEILNNVALLTTLIDFGEDHDIDEVDKLFDRVGKDVARLTAEVESYLTRSKKSQILMDGIRMTLLGPPNAGKSSLLNILADEEKAIVSSIAGTTRDAIEIPMAIGGFKVLVGDTAGIRSAQNEVEREGIKRAKKRSLSSDINLVMIGADSPRLDSDLLKHVKSMPVEHMAIVNKSDLATDRDERDEIKRDVQEQLGPDVPVHFISCKTGEGVAELQDTLTGKFKDLSWTDREEPVTVSKRIQDILQNDVLQGFEDFQMYKEDGDVVLSTEALRYAMQGIGKVTGEAVGVEEVLGAVFSQFCIGK